MCDKKKPVDDFNIFVGAKTGCFKGINVSNKVTVVKNFQSTEDLKPENEISVLNWGSSSESDILIGTVNQVVKVFDLKSNTYSSLIETNFGSGPLVGVTRINGAITTCSQSGHIKLWKCKKSEETELLTNGDVSCMQMCDEAKGIVATGGQKNDLKLWNLETKSKIFCAKNVKKDMLELEVPIWVSGIAFMNNSEYKIAVSTRHGQIRLYDTKAQRRPVIDINLKERSLNTITFSCYENQVVVGSATGHIMLADLRGKGKVLHAYKGAVGSIRQIAAHPELPYIASVGLDRFLRVHNLQTKNLLHQQYLKVRLNCILMKSSFGKEIEQKIDESENEEPKSEEEESDEEYSKIFNNMESISDEDQEPAVKKAKKNKKKSKI